MFVWQERGADLRMALQLMRLTVSCFSKIQIGFTFLVLARPGSPGQRAAKRVSTRYSSMRTLACLPDGLSPCIYDTVCV